MNMMKYCPECYKEMPPESASCPFCGYKTDTDANPESEAPKILKTPKTDSFLPPEQILLSFLLLSIFFWGINIGLTVLPIFLDEGSIKNLLIAGITAQVLTRILIGIWSIEELSLKKDQTASKKAGAFLLTFIPVGGIFSFLSAAKTMIRRDNLSNLTISAIASAVVMAILLFSTADDISVLATGSELRLGGGRTSPNSTQLSGTPGISSAIPTITLKAYQDGCRNPSSITIDEEGRKRSVCGKITNFGYIVCEDCPKDYYSFVKLDGGFQIVSYDWRFSYTWLDKCVQVTDRVEILGENAAFVFDRSEGCVGDACEIDTNGELINDGGVYFEEYTECNYTQPPIDD